MLFPPNARWLSYVSCARVILAALALGFGYLFPPGSPRIFYVLGAGFLLCSLLFALRGKGLGGFLALVPLLADLLFFLLFAALASPRLVWLASGFLLYLLTEAVVIYRPVEVVVICGVSAVVCAFLPGAHTVQLETTVVVTGALACGFAVNRQQQRREIQVAGQKLAEAQKAVDRAREAERQRIASDFHDGPLQSFISLQMRLEILRKLLARDWNAGMEDLNQLHALAQSQVRDLRAFLHSMRPVDVDGSNLVAAARRTAETFQKESGMPVTFMGTNTPVGLPPEVSLEVLQMLRESLHNVQKHAGATRVAVTVEKTDRALEFSVEDNGHGFASFAGEFQLEDLESLRTGPASLKRRARSLNADLSVESRPGRGAGLKFRIPLQ